MEKKTTSERGIKPLDRPKEALAGAQREEQQRLFLSRVSQCIDREVLATESMWR